MTTIEIKYDYVVRVSVSSDMMARLAHDPEARKALSDEIMSAIMAKFTHAEGAFPDAEARPMARFETR